MNRTDTALSRHAAVLGGYRTRRWIAVMLAALCGMVAGAGLMSSTSAQSDSSRTFSGGIETVTFNVRTK